MTERLTQAETIRLLLQRPSKVANAEVHYTRNAKGDTQLTVVVDAPIGADMDELHAHAVKVEQIAAEVYEHANRRYPGPAEK
jgi:uncharacterized protein YjbK